MKVLHLITRMNTGGPAVFLDHLTHAIHPSCESFIGYGHCESNEIDYTADHELSANLIKVEHLHKSLNPFDDVRAFFEIRKIIKTEKPKVVNTHTSKAGVLGRIAAKSVNRKIKVVHTFHGHLIYGYFARYKSLVFTVIERFLTIFTDAAVAVTIETKNSLQKLGIGRKLKWKVIHIGVPESDMDPEAFTTKQNLKLLWVGRFTGIKDPNYAIEVMSKLKRKDVELTMVGGGELFEEVKAKSEGLPITFTGWMKDPFTKIKDFDLLLITSKNEGLPLVMLEAANHHRPTIARNVGGLSEFIENNKTGFLVNGDPDEMAKIIEGLIQDRSKLQSFGNNANEVLHNEYSLKKMAGEYLDFYKGLTVRN